MRKKKEEEGELKKKKKRGRHLLSFGEHSVLEAPGDGGGGVARGLAGQRDLLVKLRRRLVAQVGDFGLHCRRDGKKNQQEKICASRVLLKTCS